MSNIIADDVVNRLTNALYSVLNLPRRIVYIFAVWLYMYTHYQKYKMPHIVYHQEVYMVFPFTVLFETLEEYHWTLQKLKSRRLLKKCPICKKRNYFKPASELVKFKFSPEVTAYDVVEALNVPDNQIYVDNYVNQLLDFLSKGDENNDRSFFTIKNSANALLEQLKRNPSVAS